MKELRLSGNKNLKDLSALQSIAPSLTDLDLSGCKGLLPACPFRLIPLTSELPATLTSLTRLDVSQCGGLPKLGAALQSMCVLNFVGLVGCQVPSLTPFLSASQHSLKVLRIDGLMKDYSSLSFFSFLTHLTIEGHLCGSLIPNLSALSSMQDLIKLRLSSEFHCIL